MFTSRYRFALPLRRLVCVLTTVALAALGVLVSASSASADTSQFRGMNWARKGDNFTTGTLVLDGLSGSDSYATVLAKADAVYASMANLLEVNTVRLPVNTHTVGSSWWTAYRGAIDAATGRGFKVILAYWEDGAASGGRITNMAAFNSMWDTVVAQYGGNDLVHFEPMNEPHGYSASEWLNVAASWVNARPSVPRGRILVGGTGFSQDLRPVCADSRLDGTLLSFHFYTFFYGQHDYAGWREIAETQLGNCASRAVVTEFGAPMDTGLDYGNPNSSDNFVGYVRAITDTMRDSDMGGTYWPALGGKVTAGQNYDWYSMFALIGSGTSLSLSIRNASGADRLRHAWGDEEVPGGQVTTITNRNSGKCVDVVSASSADGAEMIQWDCHGGTNQLWETRAAGDGHVQLVSRHSGKCLDVDGASTANNARAILWSCHGGTNQQWQLRDTGGGYLEIVARHSGRCLDVIGSSTTNGTRLQQSDCRGATSQQWR
jgi:endoglucanase